METLNNENGPNSDEFILSLKNLLVNITKMRAKLRVFRNDLEMRMKSGKFMRLL